MITPAQRAEIRRLFYGEHWKVGTIAAQLGLHHETVRAAVERETGGFRCDACRPSIVDPYLPFIRDTLAQYPSLRATRVYEMVRQRGYAGSLIQLRRLVQRLRPETSRAVYRRVVTLAGESAQVDWGSFGKVQGPQRGDTGSAGRAARRRARRRPPARPRPAPAAARRTTARPWPATSNRWRARGLGAGLRTGTAHAHAAAADADRAVSGSVCSGARARRASRGTGRAPSPSDWSCGRGGRNGIVRRTWVRLAAAVRRPVDRFAARQALDARLADARIERVLGSRRRLANAIDTAMDAILIASRTGTPATQMDRYRERHNRARRRLNRYERAVEPVVRDHDAAVRREALTRERQHERDGEWQRRKRERAEAARARQQPGGTAEPTPPAAQHRSPPRAAPAPPRAAPRPALGQVPENPPTRRRRRRPLGTRERPPTTAAGKT